MAGGPLSLGRNGCSPKHTQVQTSTLLDAQYIAGAGSDPLVVSQVVHVHRQRLVSYVHVKLDRFERPREYMQPHQTSLPKLIIDAITRFLTIHALATEITRKGSYRLEGDYSCC